MVSPFYAAEQKALYPHRTVTTSKEEAVKHLKTLLSIGLMTGSALCRSSWLSNISAIDT